MANQLSIPIWHGDLKCVEAEIRKPTAGIIAETQDRLNNEFSAMRFLTSSCVKSYLTDSGDIIEDRLKIMEISKSMPYKTLELLITEILLNYDPRDFIEGVYTCSMCGAKYRSVNDSGFDNRDRVSELEKKYYDGDRTYNVIFQEPIELSMGKDFMTITDMDLRFGTIEDFEKNYNLIRKPARLQFSVNSACIEKINGQPIDNKFKMSYGVRIFDSMTCKEDINRIQEYENSFGLNKKKMKTCNQCGSDFEVSVNLSNFFASALQ